MANRTRVVLRANDCISGAISRSSRSKFFFHDRLQSVVWEKNCSQLADPGRFMPINFLYLSTSSARTWRAVFDRFRGTAVPIREPFSPVFICQRAMRARREMAGGQETPIPCLPKLVLSNRSRERIGCRTQRRVIRPRRTKQLLKWCGLRTRMPELPSQGQRTVRE